MKKKTGPSDAVIKRAVKKLKAELESPEFRKVLLGPFHKCTNCDREMTDCENDKGKGYCEECLQECFGEGVTEYPEEE